MGRNVATFLWRTLYVQAMRRHYLSTSFQLLLVICAFSLALHNRKAPEPLGRKPNGTELDSFLVSQRPTHVVFGPNTSYNKRLMEAVVAMFSTDDTEQGDEVLSMAYNASAVSELAKHCANVATNSKRTVRPLCVTLETPADSDGHADASLKYTVFKPFPVNESQLFVSNFAGFAVGYMYAIEQAHLELQRRRTAWSVESSDNDMKMVVEDLPGWVYGDATVAYRQEFTWTIYVVFLIPALRSLNAIEYELSSGLAEKQALMGLSAVQFALGHFFTTAAFYVTESAIVIMLMYTVKVGWNHVSYAYGIDPSMVLISFFLYDVGQALTPVLVTSVCPKGWVRAVLFLAILMVAPGVFLAALLPVTVPDYLTTSRRNQLLGGIVPHSGLVSVMMIMFLAQDYEGGAGWSLVTRHVMGNKVTILEIWTLMLGSNVVVAFLIWYLPQILPWCADNPRSPVFFLTKKYWKGDTRETEVDATPVQRDPTRFEELPPDVRPIILTRDLRKVLGKVLVLDGLDLTVYERKVTVLLGQNGMGKTTLMRILTGALGGPTSGRVTVCGHSLYTSQELVRREVTLCQQSDIFFEDLTCEENAIYFATLRDTDGGDVQHATTSMLEKLNLSDVGPKMPGEISCGKARMLSLATAIASQPKLLMLDEPCSGLDPGTRRKIWGLLQQIGRERAVLLSSHDMDEADAVADQIIIMAAGRIICSGSTTFLKKACGVGYKVTLHKDPQLFNLKQALANIQSVIPGAEVHEDKQSSATIGLRTLDHRGFPALFDRLESSSKQLGIVDIAVTVATMKDVYTKINLNWIPEAKRMEAEQGEDVVSVLCSSVSKQHRTLARCFYALFVKRLTYVTRSWGILLVSFVLPLLLQFVFQASQAPNEVQEDAKLYRLSETTEVRLAYHFPGYTVVLQESKSMANLSRALQVLVEAEGCNVRLVPDVNDLVMDDLATHVHTYPMVIVLEPDRIRLMVDARNWVTLPVLLNLADTALLRLLTRQPTARIAAQVSQMVLLDTTVLHTVIKWGMFYAFTYALAFSAFASFPAAERLGGARDVQLMTGLTGTFYVLSHFAFDFLLYLAFVGPWCLIYCGPTGLLEETCILISATFVLSGPAMIGMAYLIAERALTELGAMYSAFLWIYLLGYAFIFFNPLGVRVMDYASALFPPWALLSCVIKISNADFVAKLCNRQRAAPSRAYRPDTAPTTRMSLTWGSIFPTGRRAVEEEEHDSTLARLSPCDVATSVDAALNGVQMELMFLMVQGLICLGYMGVITSGCFSWQEAIFGKRTKGRPRTASPAAEDCIITTAKRSDPEVEEEKRLATALCDKNNFKEHALVARNLSKIYGHSCVVSDFSLALRPSECFGLLGVSGSGKTTALDLLAALTDVTQGEAYTATASLLGNRRKWQSQISYCFQNGCLLDKLNAYEFLYLIARLRGVSPHYLEATVNGVISIIDLKEHASKPCGLYSGGTRRKLCVGVALLGLPPLLFLDEPYTGVDAISRDRIGRAVSRIKKTTRTAIMFASHNMDECEFSCDRFAIMANGRLTCLGTLQQLRAKHGRGYRLEFMLRHGADPEATKHLMEAVNRHFVGIKLTESHQNVLSYRLEERMPWSELFRKVELLQKDFPLEHAIAGENTLEQVFLSLAKVQEGRLIA